VGNTVLDMVDKWENAIHNNTTMSLDSPRVNAKERLKALEIGPVADKLLRRSRRGCLTW
jgi:hypothetical protein